MWSGCFPPIRAAGLVADGPAGRRIRRGGCVQVLGCRVSAGLRRRCRSLSRDCEPAASLCAATGLEAARVAIRDGHVGGVGLCVGDLPPFSVRPLSPLQGAHRRIDQAMNDSWLRRAVYSAVETPLPRLDFYDGVQYVRMYQQRGFESYLLGEYRKTGWWYFF